MNKNGQMNKKNKLKAAEFSELVEQDNGIESQDER